MALASREYLEGCGTFRDQMGREDLLICAAKTKDRVNVAKVVSLFQPNKFKYHHERAPGN